MPYRLKFDKEKCIGCYACHIACLDAHHSVGEIVPSFRAFQKVTDLSGIFEKQCVQGAFTVENVSMSARNTQFTGKNDRFYSRRSGPLQWLQKL